MVKLYGLAESSSGGKFWSCEATGSKLIIKWGKVGSKGSQKTKDYKTPGLAEFEAHKQMMTKQKGGYVFDDAGKSSPKQRGRSPTPKNSTPKKRARSSAAADKSPKKAKTEGFSARGVADSSSGGKFWSVEVSGSKLICSWGKVGTKGSQSTKEMGSAEKALKEAQKKAKAKEKGGYVMEVGEAASTKKSTPKKSTPKKSTPKKSTPKKSTPKKSTPKGKYAKGSRGEKLGELFDRVDALGTKDGQANVSDAAQPSAN